MRYIQVHTQRLGNVGYYEKDDNGYKGEQVIDRKKSKATTDQRCNSVRNKI